MGQRVLDRPMTFADASTLDPDDYPGELDRGRWVPVTRSTWRHGVVAGNVYALLRAYAKAQGGWSVSINDPGTKLGHDPDLLRGPDVGIVSEDRVPAGKGSDGWLEGAPDVAVEVVGDTQTHSELAAKALEFMGFAPMNQTAKFPGSPENSARSAPLNGLDRAGEFLAAGAKMVWVVDAEKEGLVLYTPPDHVRVLNSDEVLDGGGALPGFSCRVAEFFE